MNPARVHLVASAAGSSRWWGLALLGPASLALLIAGCATRGDVREQLRRRELAVAAEVAALQQRCDQSRLDIAHLQAAETRLAEAASAAAAAVGEARVDADRAAGLASDTFASEVRLVDESVRFAAGSSELTGDAAELLDAFAAQLLVRNEDVVIEVHGHTDSRGDEAANQRLGFARAESVRWYLIAHHGIPAARIFVTSLGSRVPAADDRSAEGRARNRRVTLVVRSR